MDFAPMELSKCPHHGTMMLRPLSRQTQEQRWCGTWYDCTECGRSVLFNSKELDAFLDEIARRCDP